MQGTGSGLRADPAARLAELEQQRPEWHTWIELLREAAQALDDRSWRVTLTERNIGSAGSDSADAPLLQGRTIKVDAAQVRSFVGRLMRTAHSDGSLLGYQPSEADAVRLVEAAVGQDPVALLALARETGVDDQALTSVAHVAAFPLLQSCGRLLDDGVPVYWPHSYCPICAAWPILAERRGLDRGRHLRCGRCGGEWEVQWLQCIYCGEREHERLGSLVPEDTGELLKVETCSSCLGYLKSVATLQAIPPLELLLQDLETVELDLVALDRGYVRPSETGFQLKVRVG
jgi:FdhE protein